MFEEKNFKSLLGGMLEKLPTHLDKREGSVVYDSLAPAALEMARMYATLDVFLQLGFLTGAEGEYLDRKTAENGVFRFPPVKAVLEITVSGYEEVPQLPIGSRLYCEKNGLYYVVKSAQAEGSYLVECVDAGASGNVTAGRFTPTATVLGFSQGNYKKTEVYGLNGESDEALRNRCLQKMTQVAAEGNIAEYHKRAEEFGGIGRIKVHPTADKVEIYLLDSNNLPPAQKLVQDFQSFLDPDSEGLGMGAAPIGAKVVVDAPKLVQISVVVGVRLIAGANLATVQQAAAQVIQQMIADISFVSTEFSYFDLASKLLEIPGVLTIASVQLNGGTAPVPLPNFVVPTLASCVVTAVT